MSSQPTTPQQKTQRVFFAGVMVLFVLAMLAAFAIGFFGGVKAAHAAPDLFGQQKGAAPAHFRQEATMAAPRVNVTQTASIDTTSITARISHLESLQKADAKNERRQWRYICYIMRWIRKHRH